MVQASDTGTERSPTVGMDAALKAKWVKALRSGRFVQGSELLRRNVGLSAQHCCLGVLCEAAGYEISDDGTSVWSDAGEHGYRLFDFMLGGRIHRDTLISMNDLQGKSFSEIADYIETNIPARPTDDRTEARTTGSVA